MIDRSTRQRRQHFAGRGDLRLVGLIRIFDDGIGVGNVEIITDQRHAERRIQMVEKDRLHVGDAVAVGIAEQRDAVARSRLSARCRPGLDVSHDDFLGTLDRRGLRRLGFDHQNIAVGQHVDRARMLKPGRHGLNLETLGHRRRLSLLPANHLGDMHRRKQILLQVGQLGIGADFDIRVAAPIVTTGKAKRGTDDQAEPQK